MVRLTAWVRALVGRRRIAREIDDELRFHVERETDALVARGVPPTDARRRALAELGGLTQTREAVDRARGGWLRAWLQAASLRGLRRQPFYGVACALTLALAVAAATTSAAVIKPALFDPLPYRADAELMQIETSTSSGGSAVSAHVLNDLRLADTPFVATTGVRPTTISYAAGTVVEGLSANLVLHDYFETLGVAPAIGRVWQADEPSAVVVSWSFWQRALDGDEAVVGRRIVIDGTSREVVGVMPHGFVAPYWASVDIWMPAELTAWLADPYRARRNVSVIARRKATVTPEDVDAYLALFSSRLRTAYPVDHADQSWTATSLREQMVGSARSAMAGTSAAAVLLLLIVAANITGVSAVRAVGLRRQTAVKLALGASRGWVMGERLAESLALSAIGSAIGVWLASILVSTLAGYQPQFLPNLAPITLPAGLGLLACLCGTVLGTGAGVLPHVSRGSRRPSEDPLRSSRGSIGDAHGTRLRSGLVAIQAALALVLVIGAGLVGQTILNLASTPLGFEPAGLTTFFIGLPATRYPTQAAHVQFDQEMLERLAAIPGVEAATASVGVPVIGGMGAGLWIQGRGETPAQIHYMSVAPNFQDTLAIPVLRGRAIDATDTAGAERTLVINETMARMFWPAGDAVGARIFVGVAPSENWMTVVGVVGDVRQHGPGRDVQPTAFGSTRQYSWGRRNFTLRTASGDPVSLATVRSAVRDVDPSIAVSAVSTYEALAANQRAQQRLVMWTLGGFATVASTLCAFGLYGVLALTSTLRRREYAIRLALGSTAGGVRWMVVRQALLLAGLGVAVGLGVAWTATRLLQGVLHGVQATDPRTFAVASLGLVIVAIVAAWLPARRAAAVNAHEVLSTDSGG